jgi:hypothetical protein
MKKNLKTLVGVALASMMTLAVATTGFAEDKTLALTGKIASADLTISVTIPTDTTITIKPYAADQISTAAASVITNTSTDLKLNVTIAGYNAQVTPATAANTITLNTTEKAIGDYSGTKKELYMSLQLSSALKAADVPSDAKTQKTAFTTPAIDVPVTKALTKAYSASDSTSYTAVTNAETVTLAAKDDNDATVTNSTAFRLTGTMNPNATWEENDAISVTPIFRITPNVE